MTLGIGSRRRTENYHQKLRSLIQLCSDETLDKILVKAFQCEFHIPPVLKFRFKGSGLLDVRQKSQKPHKFNTL